MKPKAHKPYEGLIYTYFDLQTSVNNPRRVIATNIRLTKNIYTNLILLNIFMSLNSQFLEIQSILSQTNKDITLYI